MIVLDQHRVIQPEAVIEAAAAAHGIFLQDAQTGQGLAGADDARLGALHRLHQRRRRRGDAGQMAQEIQRHPLGRENGAGRAADAWRAQRRLSTSLPSGAATSNVQRRIDQPKGDFGGDQAGDAARLARHQPGRRLSGSAGMVSSAGDVAGAAQIFRQRGADLRLDQQAARAAG